MDTQLELELAGKIEECFDEAFGNAEKARHYINTAMVAAGQCGQFLICARDAVGEKRFNDWVQAHQGWRDKGLDPVKARKLIAFAEAKREDLKQAMFTLDLLPAPQRGTQVAHPEPCEWMSLSLKLYGALQHSDERTPLTQWPVLQLETLKARLDPVVEFHKKVADAIKLQQEEASV